MRASEGIISCIVLLILTVGCTPDEEFKKEAKFITSDIALFWKTFDTISSDFPQSTFQELYINEGSVGLKDYALQKKMAKALEWRLNQKEYLDYYRNIRHNTFDYAEQIQVSKDGIRRLKEIYPATEIFDVYFLIGALTAGGRVSDNGLLIAVEMFSNIENNSLNELDYVYQRAIKTKDFIPNVIVHELVHKQQHPNLKNINYSTVLEQAIREGMADYISILILPNEPFFDIHIHEYADELEKEVWVDFKKDMHKDFHDTDWFYSDNSMSTLGYERDMGYYVGYKVLESFRQKFDSDNEAIISMLSATDYYKIFEESDYNLKFE